MAITSSWVDAWPGWLIAILVIALSLGAFAAGQWIAAHRHGGEEPDRDQEGYIIAGLSGLLALLLGFTFAIAVDRYETRRLLVLDEANAIKITYLRAETFPAADRDRLQAQLREYASTQLALGKSNRRDEAVRLFVRSARLQAAMWHSAVAAVQPLRDDVSAGYLESMGEVITAAASRKVARQANVPRLIFTVMLVYMVASSAVLGGSTSRRYRVAVAISLLLSSMSYLLIVDIDEPLHGWVTESQAPMEDLVALMVSAPRP